MGQILSQPVIKSLRGGESIVLPPFNSVSRTTLHKTVLLSILGAKFIQRERAGVPESITVSTVGDISLETGIDTAPPEAADRGSFHVQTDGQRKKSGTTAPV